MVRLLVKWEHASSISRCKDPSSARALLLAGSGQTDFWGKKLLYEASTVIKAKLLKEKSFVGPKEPH